MRLEKCQEDKKIVNYRIEFRNIKHSKRWNYHTQYKTLKDAEREALGLAARMNENYVIRVVKYTQTIEILKTQKGSSQP